MTTQSAKTMPEIRVLLGVDVIGSATNPGHQLHALWRALNRMLGVALGAVGIPPDDVVDCEHGGDGALYTLPSRHLGAALDLADRLDELAAAHNRSHKPDIRLRIAVEMGAVADEIGYYSPKKNLNRMLNAPKFKDLLRRCLRDRPEGAVNSGLIVSAPAFREAFGGDYTVAVRQHDFAKIEVVSKELTDTAFVRVPGLDARSLTEFARDTTATAEPADKPAPTGRVANQVFGQMHGVQAGDVHGDINFNPGAR